MDAKEQHFIDLLHTETKFMIPVYQRNYTWTEENCKRLLQDIKNTSKKDIHFLGSVVYVVDENERRNKSYLIIDGQQRITTITLLLLAIYNRIKETKITNETQINSPRALETTLFYDDDSSIQKFKLNLVGENHSVLQYLLNDSFNVPKNLENYRLYQNYMYFKNNLETDELLKIFDQLYDIDIVAIELTLGKDNPQKIFESLNSTGMELFQSDLIRNYILMGLDYEKQDELFIHWEQVEQNTIDKNNKPKTDEFISDVLLLRKGYRNTKYNSKKIYDLYKQANNYKNYEDLKTEVKTLKDLSIIYNKFIDPDTNTKINKELANINQLEATTTYPFLLGIISDYNHDKITENEVIKILQLVQSYVCRRYICDVNSNSLKGVFASLYRDVITEIENNENLNNIENLYYYVAVIKLYKTSNFINNDDVRDKLLIREIYKSRGNKKANYILENLENYGNKEIQLTEFNTIEHIFPQKPKLSSWEVVGEDNFNFLKDKLNTLANLTLTSENSTMGNKSFSYKKEHGFNNSTLWLNSELKTYDKWTKNEYEKRFTSLYSKFIQVWEYPEDIITQSDTIGIIHVDLFNENYDYKQKEIIHIIFDDKSYTDQYNTAVGIYRDIFIDMFSQHKEHILNNNAFNEYKFFIHNDEQFKKSSYMFDLDSEYKLYTSLTKKDIFKRLRILAQELHIDKNKCSVAINTDK